MTQLIVPALDARPWPTLGPQVCDFIEDGLIFGPGDLRGSPATVDDEQRALIYRMYEVHPHGSARAGKRRFQRVGLSLRKGLRKTELAAWIAAVELHPDGPVRCDGFQRVGSAWQPVGRPVMSPYIPMVAYTEEQSEDLAFGVLYTVLSEGPLADDFDIGLERIMRRDGKGKAVALANAPDARDGALTTFELFDETHRLILPRQRKAHSTMLANLLKRPIADPWALETTTMYVPGEGSVAESTHEYARQVAAGKIGDGRLFFFHRQAADKADISTRPGLRKAVVEASGAGAVWSDIDGIVAQWDDPDADRDYLNQAWLNRPGRRAAQAFDTERWKLLAKPDYVVAPGSPVTAGFDGSKTGDWTALIATELATGHQWPVGIWDPAEYGGEIPRPEVDVAVDELFTAFKVIRFYYDPPYWKDEAAAWRGRYGEKIVLPWETWRNRPMGGALRNYATAMAAGSLSHPGDQVFTSHIGHCYRRWLSERDDKGVRLWTVQKERPDSPLKIDGAVAGCLSWEARMDAIAAGANPVLFHSNYEHEGLTVAGPLG